MQPPGPVFHVALRPEWAAAGDTYAPAALRREGFVHCATAAQLPGVLARHFAGRTDVVVLTIDVGRLDVPLRFEAPQDPRTGAVDASSAERFPHVYGPIPVTAITAVREVAST